MWRFDPEIFRQLDDIREMVALRHLTPTREWPLIVMDANDELFVVRRVAERINHRVHDAAD